MLLSLYVNRARAGFIALQTGYLFLKYCFRTELNTHFLPILYRAWFKRISAPWQEEKLVRHGWRETGLLLLFPPLVSAIAVIATVVLADYTGSPLSWVKLIAAHQYLP
ncbi:MAG: hypothetical protein ACOH2K_05360 [Burkholderiaceae bacterium]